MAQAPEKMLEHTEPDEKAPGSTSEQRAGTIQPPLPKEKDTEPLFQIMKS